MKLIDNYINAVIKFLSNKQEIAKELQEMIFSMLESKYGYKEIYSEEEVVAVLKELGNPHFMALKYSNLPDHIVGSKYIYQFYYILAIILIVVSVGSLFHFVFSVVGDPKEVFRSLGLFLSDLIWGSFACFGILTFIFMLLEHSKKEVKIGKNFNPLDLKHIDKNDKVNAKKLLYKRSESILELIISIIVLLFFNYFPGIIALYSFEDPKPILNLEFIESIVWIINITLSLSMIGQVYKLISPEKTIAKALGFYAFGLICCIALTLTFSNSQYLSEGFLNWLRDKDISSSAITYADFQQYIVMVIIGICVIVYTIEFIVNVGRVLMLRKKK
jgi:hypothetical protein